MHLATPNSELYNQQIYALSTYTFLSTRELMHLASRKPGVHDHGSGRNLTLIGAFLLVFTQLGLKMFVELN